MSYEALKPRSKSRLGVIIALMLLALAVLGTQSIAYAHGLEHIAQEQTDDCDLCKPIDSGKAILLSNDRVCSTPVFHDIRLYVSQTTTCVGSKLHVNRGPPAYAAQ